MYHLHRLHHSLRESHGGPRPPILRSVEAHPVDPRDIEREVDHPTYRVIFWEQGPPAPIGEAPGGFRSDEYDVTGAGDVEAVIAWARGRAIAGQTFTVSALVDSIEVRLLGDDPTRTDSG